MDHGMQPLARRSVTIGSADISDADAPSFDRSKSEGGAALAARLRRASGITAPSSLCKRKTSFIGGDSASEPLPAPAAGKQSRLSFSIDSNSGTELQTESDG